MANFFFKLKDFYIINFSLDLKHSLDDKTSQLDSARHKIQELHSQLSNNEKVITEQKRLLRAVKEEYEEKFRVSQALLFYCHILSLHLFY